MENMLSIILVNTLICLVFINVFEIINRERRIKKIFQNDYLELKTKYTDIADYDIAPKKLLLMKLKYVYEYFVPNVLKAMKKKCDLNCIKNIAYDTMELYERKWIYDRNITQEFVEIFIKIHDINLKIFMIKMETMIKKNNSYDSNVADFKGYLKTLMINTINDFENAIDECKIKKITREKKISKIYEEKNKILNNLKATNIKLGPSVLTMIESSLNERS